MRTHCSEQTLSRVIASLQRQTLPPTEIIVVDNGSSDATRDIALATGCRLISYPDNEEFNYSRALNLGSEKATAPFLFNLSSHVILMDTKTAEDMVDELLASPDACGIFLGNQVFHESEVVPCPEKVVSRIDRSNFRGNNGFRNSAGMLRRKNWEDHPFREDMPTCEDQEWALWHIHRNSVTLQLDSHPALYLNPHINARKIAREHLVIGLFVQPDWLSLTKIPSLLYQSLRSLFKGNLLLAKGSALTAWWLLIMRHRNLGTWSRYW